MIYLFFRSIGRDSSSTSPHHNPNLPSPVNEKKKKGKKRKEPNSSQLPWRTKYIVVPINVVSFSLTCMDFVYTNELFMSTYLYERWKSIHPPIRMKLN